jgi:hypothetical protein
MSLKPALRRVFSFKPAFWWVFFWANDMPILPVAPAAILGAWAAGIAVVAFVGGFVVSDWRTDGKIAKLDRDKQVLELANRRCGQDVENVKSTFAELKRVSDERLTAAANAVKEAEREAQAHVEKAVVIRKAPPVPADKQCAAIVREQQEYLVARQAGG